MPCDSLRYGKRRLHVTERGEKAGVHADHDVVDGLVLEVHPGHRGLGVVDQHVDASEGVDGLLDRVVDVVVLGAVGDDGQVLGAGILSNSTLVCVERLLADVGDGHRGAGLEQRGGHPLADAACGAGDDRYLAVELDTHEATA